MTSFYCCTYSYITYNQSQLCKNFKKTTEQIIFQLCTETFYTNIPKYITPLPPQQQELDKKNFNNTNTIEYTKKLFKFY